MCCVFADQTAKIWDLAAGVETRSLDGHPASVVSVKFSPTNHLVYTASAYLVTVWDPRRARCVHTLTSVDFCLSLSVHACRFFWKIWNRGKVWEFENGQGNVKKKANSRGQGRLGEKLWNFSCQGKLLFSIQPSIY